MKRELPLSQDPNTTLFFSKIVHNCVSFFSHYSDSLWYMYRLSFHLEFRNNWLIKTQISKLHLKVKTSVLLLKKFYWRL